MDITMMHMLNGQEREVDDWRQLFHTADSRFRFIGSRRPLGTKLSVIEAIWEV